jgi:hypothetical protein
VRHFSQFPDWQIADFLSDRSEELERILGPVHGGVDHRKHQTAAAVRCFSFWTMAEELVNKFRDENEQRKCAKALGIAQDAILFGQFSIQDLILSSGLIPSKVPEEPNPLDEIPCRKLNASILVDVGHIELEWTNDLSRHLMLENGILSIFSMPCKLLAPGSGEFDPQEALMCVSILPIQSKPHIQLMVIPSGQWASPGTTRKKSGALTASSLPVQRAREPSNVLENTLKNLLTNRSCDMPRASSLMPGKKASFGIYGHGL